MNIDGTVTIPRWFNMPNPRSYYQNNINLILEDCAKAADAEVDFTKFSGINTIYNEWGGFSYGGWGTLTLDGVTKEFNATWLAPGHSTSRARVRE
jgi:hypothetical protein